MASREVEALTEHPGTAVGGASGVVEKAVRP